MKVRFSSNWTNGKQSRSSSCASRRTQQTGSGQGPNENHVIAGFVDTDPTKSFLTILLQGPNGNFRDLREQPQDNPQANLSDGNWHVMEVLFGPESTPGAGNGTYQAWVDGIPDRELQQRAVARARQQRWLALPPVRPGVRGHQEQPALHHVLGLRSAIRQYAIAGERSLHRRQVCTRGERAAAR